MSIERGHARRDAAARHARGALLALGRRDHLGRAVHGPVRDGRLRPRPVHDQGRLARLHLVRAGRPRAHDPDPPRRRPAPRRRDRQERQVARPRRWTTGCRRPTSRASNTTIKTRSCCGSSSASPPTGSSTRTCPCVRKDFEEIEAARQGGGQSSREPPTSTTTPTPRSSRTRRPSDPTTGRAPPVTPAINNRRRDGSDRPGDRRPDAGRSLAWWRPSLLLGWEVAVRFTRNDLFPGPWRSSSGSSN